MQYGPCQMQFGPNQVHLQLYHMVIACTFYRLADRVHVDAYTTQHSGLMELCCKKHGDAIAAAEPIAANL